MHVFGVGRCIVATNECAGKVREGEKHPFLQRVREISWERAPLAGLWESAPRHIQQEPFGTG